MSTTSDSDDEVEARKALLQQFRARKHAQAKDAVQPAELSPAAADDGEPPLCVQIGWPRDYVEYTGLWADAAGANGTSSARIGADDPAAGAAMACRGGGAAAGRQPDGVLGANVQFVPYKRRRGQR